MTFDEKLAQALGETFNERMARRMAVSKKHRFSAAYKVWEYKTLRNIGKDRYDKRWTLRRARFAVAVVMIVSSLLIGVAAYAVSAAIGRYYFDTKPDHSKLLIEGISSDKTYLAEYYGLPEEDGWEITYFYADEMGTVINYKYNEKTVTFGQEVIRGNMGNINTENVEVEPISIYKENDGFLIIYGENDVFLTWIYDGYLLSLNGNLNKNEMVNLAHSTKIVDFQKYL